MHILILQYAYNAEIPSAAALLTRYATLSGWAEALRTAGARVSVVQRFHTRQTLNAGSLCYEFVRDPYRAMLPSYRVPAAAHGLVRAARPDIVHVNGLLFPLQIRALRAALPPECRILAQHHAERPWRGLRALLQRWALRVVDGFFFAAHGLAQSWVRAGMIGPKQSVYEIAEGSSTFAPADRPAARAISGVKGDPALLWVGRLNATKDPLTLLDGFARVLDDLPQAHLSMLYGSADLLPQVQARLADNPRLAAAVTLVGQVAHTQIEAFYQSADYFVAASHYEGSGYALAEALACGVPPIVSDIPTFRVATANGAFGALWPVGDPAALAAAILTTVRRPREPLARAARTHFEAQLSYPAIAQQALAAYQDLVRRVCESR